MIDGWEEFEGPTEMMEGQALLGEIVSDVNGR